MNATLKTLLVLLPLSVAIITTTLTGRINAVTVVLLLASWVTTKVDVTKDRE